MLYRETSSRLAKAEEESNRLHQELTSARRRGASLDADFHNKERTVNQLRTKVAVLEQVCICYLKIMKTIMMVRSHVLQELKDKEILLTKHQDLLSAAQEQKV